MLHLHGTGVQVWQDAMGRLKWGQETKTELIWSSAWDVTRIIVKVNGHLSCLTLPAVSGVESFLCSSVKDCTALLQRALKRGKGQNKKQQQKRKYLDKTISLSFFFRSAYEYNHISNGALERSWNDLSAHHSCGFPLKRTKTQLVYLWWFNFVFLICSFSLRLPQWHVVVHKAVFFSPIWTWQQGKHSFIQTAEGTF